MNQKIIGSLLEKKVTRKEFLHMCGLGIIGVTGFSAIVDMLSGHGSQVISSQEGFGSGLYGGNGAVANLSKHDSY